MSRRTVGFLLVLLSGACFGALGVLGRLAYASGVDVPTLLFLRFTLAGALLGVGMALKRERLPRGRLLGWLVLLGAVGYASQAMVFFSALRFASAGLVALLLFVHPALVALLAVLLFGERLGRPKVLAVGLALAGSALTVDPSGGAQPLGLVLGLAAAFLYAGYVVASSRVVGTAGPLASSTVVLASAAVSYGLLVLVRGPVLPGTPEGWAAVVGLTLVSTVMATLTFFAGLERVGPVTASLLSAVEPVVAVLLGAAFLGERLSLLQGVGGLLILVAVGLLARADSSRA